MSYIGNQGEQSTASEIEALENLTNLAGGTGLFIRKTGITTFENASEIGLGDVVGASVSTNNAIARYNGITGKLIQNSSVLIDDSDNITGVVSITSPILLGGSTTTQDLTLQTTSGVGATGADIHFLVGNNGATEAMTILNNGNVGIGTTAPTELLEIASPASSIISLRAVNLDIFGSSVLGEIRFAGDDTFSSEDGVGAKISGLADGTWGGTTNDYPSKLVFYTNPDGLGALAERMRIDKNGNVGIGTTSPTALLHLSAGTATNPPLKLTTGTLLTTPEAGAIEFLDDAYYGTITTAGERKEFAFSEDVLKLDQTTPQTIINGQPVQDTLTASELVATDASKKLQSLAVATYPSLAELAYVKGVTSSIQDQIDNIDAPVRTYTVSSSGGDFTTIQDALNDSGGVGTPESDIVILVYPGTYTDDTISFTANNQEVRGMGISPNSVKVTTANSNIVDYAAYTGCRINRVRMEVTAATTLVHTVTGTTGSCNLVKCHTSMTTSYATAGAQPSTIHSGGAGTMKIVEGTAEYTHSGSNAAIAKALLNCEANNCNITFELVNININCSNNSFVSGICFGTGATTVSINECDIDIEDNGTAIVVGLYVGGALSGEFLYNNVHITGTGALAVGMYVNAAGADIRTMYNHIHVSGATTNNSFFLNDFASTLTSQFDDIIAVDGVNNVGVATLVQLNSPTDGTLLATTFTGNLTGDVTGNADTVTGLTLNSEALTLNTGALTLTPNADDSSVLTLGAGASSIEGSNTGDQDLSSYAPLASPTFTGTVTLPATTLGGIMTSSKAINITMANAGNDVPLTITQNDVTNNPNGLNITNAGTGNGLFIDQNGNGIALNIDSEATTGDVMRIYGMITNGDMIVINNEGNMGANIGTNYVMRVIQNNSSAAGDNVEFRNDGTGRDLILNQVGNGVALTIDSGSTSAPLILLDANADVEIFDFDACTDKGTSHTTVAGSIKVQMPNGSTGYINVYT